MVRLIQQLINGTSIGASNSLLVMGYALAYSVYYFTGCSPSSSSPPPACFPPLRGTYSASSVPSTPHERPRDHQGHDREHRGEQFFENPRVQASYLGIAH
jgi:hypothetical protein